MRIIDQIRNRDAFTPTENTIVSYLEENSRNVVNMSLEQLASTLYVSKSSIIRLCKKMGFKGHKELCVELAKEIDTLVYENELINSSVPFRESDSIQAVAGKTLALTKSAVSETFSEMDLGEVNCLAEKIHNADTVYIYAVSECAIYGEFFAEKLVALGINVEINHYPGSMLVNAARQKKGSCALFLTYSLFNSEMRRSAEILKENGIQIFLICGMNKNQLQTFADHVIRIHFYEPSPKISNIGSSSGIIYLLNVIYGVIFNMDYKQNMDKLRAVGRAVRDYHG